MAHDGSNRIRSGTVLPPAGNHGGAVWWWTRCYRAVRRHPWRAGVSVLLAFVLLLNAVAFAQAWAMTHFVAAGMKTASPEKLTVFGKAAVLVTGIRVPRPVNRSTPADFGLPFIIRHVDSGGIDLETWYVPAAGGRHRGLVMMYHGYSAAKSSLLDPASEFHAMGCDVVMTDFRGSGGSAGDATTIGYAEADDVIATVKDAVTFARVPGEPVVLFGESMGAAAILRAVGDLHLTVDGLLLESPYDRLLSTAENRFASMGLPAFPLAPLLVFWGGVQHHFWAFGLNPAESAAGVRCPAVVFQGGLDPRVTTPQARAVFDHLGGRRQFELYPSAGHLGMRSADPVRWRSTVGAFLDSLRPLP